jgi:hypothetical protein
MLIIAMGAHVCRDYVQKPFHGVIIWSCAYG